MPIELPPEIREAFRKAGRKGGLRNAAVNDLSAALVKAREAKEGRWLFGHGCKVCGPHIDIAEDLPMHERRRRAEALKKLHYTLMAEKSHKAR